MQIFGDLDAPFGLSLTPDFPMDGGKRSDGEIQNMNMPYTKSNQLTHHISDEFMLEASGSELMTYQPTGGNHSVGGQVDLGQLLCDASNNDKHVSGECSNWTCEISIYCNKQSPPNVLADICINNKHSFDAAAIDDNNADDTADEPMPDYLSHDLNTPNVERKSISFRSRTNR